MTSSFMNSVAFMANVMNIVLASGVFTLPFSIYETGFILGGIVLLVIAFISYTTAGFLIEALAIANSIHKEENEIFDNLSTSIVSNASKGAFDEFYNSHFHGVLKLNNSASEDEVDTDNENKIGQTNTSNSEVTDSNQNLINNEDKTKEKSVKSKKSGMSLTKSEKDEKEDNFYIFKRFEILKMSKSVLNKPLYACCLLIMIGYLYISLTSNAVLLGSSIEKIIIKTFDLPVNKDDSVGLWYYVVTLGYYILIILISLRNIEELKKFTSIIMAMRFIIITLIFGICIYTIAKYGATDWSEIPKFNFKNITLMLGNTLFYFMIQHSVPGIVEGFRPQKNLNRLLFISFLTSFIIFYLYALVTLLAFGKYKTCDYNDEYPTAIMNYFNLNFLDFNFLGYIINYYPLFNIITGSIQLISLKNNFVVAIGGCYSGFSSKYEENRKVSILKCLFPSIIT